MEPLKPIIELIYGPMGSGKTTELLRRGNVYRVSRRSVVYVKPRSDGRSGPYIRTHDADKGVLATLLDTLCSLITMAEVVCVDEGQFFSDLVEGCERLVRMGKVVVVAALNGDTKRRPFLPVAYLVSHCDRTDLFHAQCWKCGRDAPFTAHDDLESGVVKIGGLGEYQPLCRMHHDAFLAEGKL
ncbi:MAG: hypothetical protein WC483_00475 [Candidatus Paceibacterota bacterium]